MLRTPYVLLLLGLSNVVPAAVNAQTPAAKPAAVDSQDLTGRYMAGCHKMATLHKRFGVDTVAFTADKHFIREIKEYNEHDCKETGLLTVRAYTGTYDLKPSSKVKGANDIDFIIAEAFAAAFGDEVVKEFNTSKTCGKVDWKTGVRRSVLGTDCPGQPLSAGTRIYDLVERTNDQIFFGDTGYFRDDSAPDKRATKINYDLPFVRVEGRAAH